MNIFVGNVSFDAAKTDLRKLFEGFGRVACAAIVMQKNKKTPKPRGFGFVEMPDESQARAAIAALNGKEFMGRILRVNTARLKKEIQPVDKPGKKSWPKKENQPRPWQKIPGEHKTWKRDEEGPKRPWKRAEGEVKPRSNFRRSGFKPWERIEGRSRPRGRPERGFESEERFQGELKLSKKSGGESRLWKKPAGETKPWVKRTERPRRSGFNPSAALRTAMSERSELSGRRRTKGREKSG